MATPWTATGHFALLFILMRGLRIQDGFATPAPALIMHYFCRNSFVSSRIHSTDGPVCLFAFEILHALRMGESTDSVRNTRLSHSAEAAECQLL